MKKIAMITTWPPAKCGIAEYSSNLVKALINTDNPDIELTVVNIKDLWTNPDLSGFDLVHFQNQGSFWPGDWFSQKLEYLKQSGIRTVVTFHDSAVWDGFNGWKFIDMAIAHRGDIFIDMPVGNHYLVMPMPIPEYPVKLCGYGLGRSDHKLLAEICEKLGYKYSFLDPKKGWLTQDELVDWIKKHDGVILWYNDVKIKGSSAGARLALAARRPLFVNNIGWFADVEGQYVKKFDSVDDLRDGLLGYYKIYSNYSNIIKTQGFSAAADKHITIYKKLMEGEL